MGLLWCLTDDGTSVKAKIDQFLNGKGRYKDTASKLWSINDGTLWRIEHILTKELSNKWDLIDENQDYVVYAGIACFMYIEDYPSIKDLTTKDYEAKVLAWENEKNRLLENREDIAFDRQNAFDSLVKSFNGEF